MGRGHSRMRAAPSHVRGQVRSGPLDPQVLLEWINTELLPEHIVVRSLEEDMFDGLILHHLFRKWCPAQPAPLQVGSSPASSSHPC